MADPQQLTTLQYCLIDNCTIIRIDTEQQLDIVCTTQSHLVVTPADGQTSMFISKNDPKPFCFTPYTTDNFAIIIQISMGRIMVTLVGLVSGCTNHTCENMQYAIILCVIYFLASADIKPFGHTCLFAVLLLIGLALFYTPDVFNIYHD